MSDPSWPPPGQHGGWQPYPAPPGYPSAYPGYPDAWAPYGRHPVTGQPYSPKSKVTAALLQLLGFFGFLGFGRMYLGQTGLGLVQLLIGVLATITTYGLGIIVPFAWGVIDAVLILSGRVHDKQGRLLRGGT
ncbi:NINE protein [Mycolicibacter arupensis]|uniref:NINE protein n=1 Tax=Mycolicibacter arupensis TaxID=342002 RepID=UPI003B3B089C